MSDARLEPIVIHEDADFVAVDKPAGWLTVPSRFEKGDERAVVGRWLERAHPRIFPVHRLDQEVGGLVLFAKTAAGQRTATKWFENRTVAKTYQGLSEARDFSHWPADLRAADAPIEVGQDLDWRCRILRGKRRAYEHPKGDPAVTTARLLGVDKDGFHRWILRPQTGRGHQLRFEMSRHGYPLLGDALYGSNEPWSPGIALRAVVLDFSAVVVGERGDLPKALRVEGFFP